MARGDYTKPSAGDGKARTGNDTRKRRDAGGTAMRTGYIGGSKSHIAIDCPGGGTEVAHDEMKVQIYEPRKETEVNEHSQKLTYAHGGLCRPFKRYDIPIKCRPVIGQC